MTALARILIFAAFGWFFVQLVMIGFFCNIRSLGRPSIPWPALLIAKIAIGISAVLMLRAAFTGETQLPLPVMVLCLALLLGGVFLSSPALYQLGRNLRLGLPGEDTDLVTSGVFRISRNPVYVGIYLMMAASLVYAFSWINAVAVATAILLHHRIILAEERFLAGRFKGYGAYRARVRRYL
jgi:protein-S-isoprenylcysteine O-methyltransferase Ste14